MINNLQMAWIIDEYGYIRAIRVADITEDTVSFRDVPIFEALEHSDMYNVSASSPYKQYTGTTVNVISADNICLTHHIWTLVNIDTVYYLLSPLGIYRRVEDISVLKKLCDKDSKISVSVPSNKLIPNDFVFNSKLVDEYISATLLAYENAIDIITDGFHILNRIDLNDLILKNNCLFIDGTFSNLSNVYLVDNNYVPVSFKIDKVVDNFCLPKVSTQPICITCRSINNLVLPDYCPILRICYTQFRDLSFSQLKAVCGYKVNYIFFSTNCSIYNVCLSLRTTKITVMPVKYDTKFNFINSNTDEERLVLHLFDGDDIVEINIDSIKNLVLELTNMQSIIRINYNRISNVQLVMDRTSSSALIKPVIEFYASDIKNKLSRDNFRFVSGIMDDKHLLLK